MADQEDSVASPPSVSIISETPIELTIHANLKFLISNLKNLVLIQLLSDTYPIWHLHLLQHFSANGFSDHLTGETPCPANSTSSAHRSWVLVDRNLILALFSTISPSILPYVISSTTTNEVWTILELRLQPSNRSRVIKLKHELHIIQMKYSTMQQYLTQIKNIDDNIDASGSKIDSEDIIIYILNGLPALPASYNPFKSSI
ncbi:uncharacterized protein LOC110113427 [Dendrobium catenatum]|uniref:uncharacterized protein LOC110113427 n=1 Tax=Dendrobium catenatum TaxID=906689 RepID=UPI0009F71815|nr:uncharacterized protein LOC110113427 [Dendrobium catenatum]